MKVTSIGFGNWRSVGPDMVWVDLRKKINFFAGKNNAGKSNVLQGLDEICRTKWLEVAKSETEDYHQKNAMYSPILGIGIISDGTEPYCAHLGTNEIRITANKFTGASGRHQFEVIGDYFTNLQPRALGEFYTQLTSRIKPDIENYEASRVAARIEIVKGLVTRAFALLPKCVIVPHFRTIGEYNSQYKPSGEGLIMLLDSWQHPDEGLDEDQKKFERVRNIMRHLLHSSDLRLEVSGKNNQILVTLDNLRQSVQRYGTGVHELLMLTVALEAYPDYLFCIEEPEIHLHPQLLKEFLVILREHNPASFVITTHSSALLRLEDDIQLCHLWRENGATQSRLISASSEAVQLLDDLGYKASDILQANCIIWVEGPSDRTYLNKWLNLIAPELKEGFDYQAMFYGGKLLSHLAADELIAESEGLIDLLKINQHSFIIMDRDRNDATTPINETKRRILNETAVQGSGNWLTEGREIENYLPLHAIKQVFDAKTGTPGNIVYTAYSKLDESLRTAYGTALLESWEYGKAKADYARDITPLITAADVSTELRAKLDHLITFIRASTEKIEPVAV